MIRMIREIRDGKELRIILCSHLLRDVEDTCDEVMILKQGRIAHYSNLGRRAPREQAISGAGNLRREWRFHRSHRKTRLRVRGDREPHEDDSRRWSRDCATSIRLAAEREVRIRRLNFRRDTLEDIFMKAMEN
jgi:ABC-2 type transport system ATP-binding protein